MKLSYVFTQLTTGEFKQLAIGGQKEGGIFEKNQHEVIGHLQLGLTDLHTRFNLKLRRLSVPMVPGTLDYALAPTTKDLLKVIEVKGQDGVPLSLNDASDTEGVETDSFNQLAVPPSVAAAGGQLVVKYRADHPPLPNNPEGLTRAALDAAEVHLPPSHLQALLLFVAARAHRPTGMVNEFNASTNYTMLYETECERLKGQNLEVDAMAQHSEERFRRGGWC